MIEDFTSEAMAYLLEQLNPADRARFEERLARDAAMAAAFKTCVDSLAEFALDEAPVRAIDWPERQNILTAALARIDKDPSRASKPPSRMFLWKAAAALLFATNLGLLFLHFKERRGPQPTKPAMAATPAALLTAAPSSGKLRTTAVTVIPAKVSPKETEKEIKKEIARLAALREEYGRLRAARDALNAEYQSILRQLAQQAIVDAGTDKFVAMQLVDAKSYANGIRNSSPDLSQPILTSPGVVAAGPPTSTTPIPTSPSGTTPQSGNLSSTSSTSSTPVTAVPPGNETTVSTTSTTTTASVSGVGTVTPTNSSTTTPTDTNSPPTNQTNPSTNQTTTPTDQSSVTAPSAWSLFDEANDQGFLDLSNLPQVSTDQTLELWVQPVGSQDFVPVGSIPAQFYGGSGSVYYKLPSATMTPSQILITVEPKANAPTVPTGTTVLRGP